LAAAWSHGRHPIEDAYPASVVITVFDKYEASFNGDVAE